jgi:hypothetical protein
VTVSTLFIAPGGQENVGFSVPTQKPYVGQMKIYFEKDGLIIPSVSEEVYMGQGVNTFDYSLNIGKMLGEGIYTLTIEIDGSIYTIPVKLNSEQPEIEHYISENNSTISLTFGSNESVEVDVSETSITGDVATKGYSVSPVEGYVTIEEEVCQNCKLAIGLWINEGPIQIVQTYGIYDEPYLKITDFNSDKLTLETCMTGNYEIFVDNQKMGDLYGIGKTEIDLGNGYDSPVIALSGSKEFTKQLDLSRIISLAPVQSLQVIKQTPFTVRLVSFDEYGRELESTGYLLVFDENQSVVKAENISFSGEYIWKFNLPNGTYSVRYNNLKSSGNAIEGDPIGNPVIPEDDTLVPKDLIPYLIGLLMVAIAIMVGIWVKRLNRKTGNV